MISMASRIKAAPKNDTHRTIIVSSPVLTPLLPLPDPDPLIFSIFFSRSADKDGQIIYDNQARKWYLGDTEYSGSIDSKETLAVWWTVFETADGKDQ